MRYAVLLLVLPAFAVAAPVPKVKAPEIDIRDPDGKVLLAADDLASYDWATHTITVKGGVKQPFLDAVEKAKRFAVCVNGQPVVHGRYVSPGVIATHTEPVISRVNGKGYEDLVTIEGGYPELRPGDPDQRDVKKLKDALEKAGKLKVEK